MQDTQEKAPEQELTTSAGVESASVEAKEADGVMDVIEEIVEETFEVGFDKLFAEGLELVKKAIPGEQFDGIATVLLTQVKPHIKSGSLKLIDKIDGKKG